MFTPAELSRPALEDICLRLFNAGSDIWEMEPRIHKVCFVTTGATAAFPELVQAALSPECLQVLADNGFTKLNFQCGDTFRSFNDLLPADLKGLDIEAFDFNKDGLNREMRECQAREGVSKKGLLICHAGMFLISQT